MKNKYGDALSSLADVTKQAVNGLSAMTGTSRDRELAMYNRLKPIDFERLTKMHGVDVVADYIRDMEKRRIKENSYGK